MLAATGHVSLASLALFAIIFVWTPPHFWALALVKADDFDRAGIPMLPNVKGAGPHAPRHSRSMRWFSPRSVCRPGSSASPRRSMARWPSRLARLMLFHAARVYVVARRRARPINSRCGCSGFRSSISSFSSPRSSSSACSRWRATALPVMVTGDDTRQARGHPADAGAGEAAANAIWRLASRSDFSSLLVYVVTIVKLGPAVLDRPL